MHTRIACRISVIKRIDSRMWLPIESAGPRNWTTYISRQSSNNTVQLHFESVQKPHPIKKKKQTKIALIYLFFECNFPSIFWTLNFNMKRNSHAAPLKIFKNWITQSSLRWQFMQSTHLGLWLRVSLESRFGFGFWASGLLKSKVFFCVQIDFCILCICCCGWFCSCCCCFYLSCQLKLWNICWYFSFIFGGDTATASQAFLRSWQ